MSIYLVCAQEALPLEDQLVSFHAIRDFLHTQLNSVWSGASIEAYGSVACNLLLPDSDVDLSVTFNGVQVAPYALQSPTRIRTLAAL
jgi:DNA polymerase sigma